MLGPGASGRLRVYVDTQDWFGQMSHQIRYTTNDPARPQVTLTVKGIVAAAP